MLQTDLPAWQMAIRLLVAALGGAVLGVERETQDKPAGLRTNMLVSVGAAAFMVISDDLVREALAYAAPRTWRRPTTRSARSPV